MEYGLIGAKLGHSYSKIIHEAVCGYSYELHPLPTEKEAHAFMQAKAFKAINVTIPYKSWSSHIAMRWNHVRRPSAQ